MISFEKVVRKRIHFLQLRGSLEETEVTSLFPEINWLNADNGFWHAIKYQINFFFFNFGLEVSFVRRGLCVSWELLLF